MFRVEEKRTTWGPWTVDYHSNAAYLTQRGRWLYEIDLDRCKTSGEVLDWICQVAKKTWATDVIVAQMVRMLDAVLDPQGQLVHKT